MVSIKSVVKSSPIGKWYISIIDPGDSDNEIICNDVYEYADKIEEVGQKYGGLVNVVWSSDDNVTQVQIHEVRMQMMAYEAEQEAIKNKDSHLPDGTPNFQVTDMDTETN